MAEIRVNSTGGVKLFDADDSHYAQIKAGTISSNTDVLELGSGAVVAGTKVDLNGQELILDADADTSITADTDDQIDVRIAGADDFQFTANTFTAQSGSSIVVPDGGLTFGSTAISSTAAELNILDGVTSTAAELNILDGVTSTTAELNIMDGVTATAAEINLIDGGTARGTTAIADGDGVLINDDGTMRMTTVQTLATYIGGGTLVKVGDVRSNSAASSHQLNGIFSDTYDKYFFSLSTFPSTGNSEVHMQFVDGSNNAVTSSYRGVVFGKNQAGTDKTHNSTGTSEMKLNNGHGNGRAFQAQGYIMSPTSGIDNAKQLHFQSGGFDNANDFEYQIGGFFHTSATDYTGILVKTNSGNLTAISLQVYGIVDTKHYNGS